jgi:hypothetical protein
VSRWVTKSSSEVYTKVPVGKSVVYRVEEAYDAGQNNELNRNFLNRAVVIIVASNIGSGHTITVANSVAVECEGTIYLSVLQSCSQRRR